MEHGEATISILRRLKELGVCLAIDDFGTGYSSLSYLKHFPLDRLKIDRSFVKDIGTERDDGAIAAAVIAMAKTLGLDVIAEGVEEKEQYFFLRERGCEEIQGFFFAKPMPAEDFESLLHRGGFELPLAAGI